MNDRQQTATTVLGPDLVIKGEMTFEGSVRLLGTFEGRMEASGDLHVGEGAHCRAEVHVARIVVDGEIEGNVHAAERIQLNESAVVKGDVAAGAMSVADGATFMGACQVGAAAVAKSRRSTSAPTVESRPAKPVEPAPVEAVATPAQAMRISSDEQADREPATTRESDGTRPLNLNEQIASIRASLKSSEGEQAQAG
ncbi:MAG: polymer-forming cytoskeletal protein [Planctomycetota bacterium]